MERFKLKDKQYFFFYFVNGVKKNDSVELAFGGAF